MTEHIAAAIKEAERVSKKQKVCATKTSDSLNNLIDELTAAKHRIAAEGSTDAVINDLNKRLGQLNTVHTISEQTKDLHSTVNKLSKVLASCLLGQIGHIRTRPPVYVSKQSAEALLGLLQAIDKAFVPDICKASKGKQFDEGTLNQVSPSNTFFKVTANADPAILYFSCPTRHVHRHLRVGISVHAELLQRLQAHTGP